MAFKTLLEHNILGITNQIELNQQEEIITKQKAKLLFDSGDIEKLEIGTFSGLAEIHQYLFGDIYDFAGKIRQDNMSKGNTRFAPVIYLNEAVETVSKMPESTVEEIVEKYVEMNVAHPFREGNGRATRIWLDLIFKKRFQKVVDWNKISKDEYMGAMISSFNNDHDIKKLLTGALVDNVAKRSLYISGIDVSYFYEGYSQYRTEEV
ncbi:cell filamentation protein [Actinomycetota bacterium]|nr:cell filamentation protein [Actinomycetota bacterium]